MLNIFSTAFKRSSERFIGRVEEIIIKHMPFALEMAYTPTQSQTSSSQIESLFDISIWNMAAPKSKVHAFCYLQFILWK